MFGILIICLTFLANPYIGVIIATIIVYDYQKKKKLAIKNIENKNLWPKICPRPGTTPTEILIYRGCTLEIYREPFNVVRIIKPSGKDLGCSFSDLSSAIRNLENHVD